MNEISESPESSNNSSENIPEIANDEVIFKPQNDIPFPIETDLNEIFPDEDKDLNDLFPDEETKLLLKKMQKNKKDLHTMKDRFLDEDWISDAIETTNEETTNEESTEQKNTEHQAEEAKE